MNTLVTPTWLYTRQSDPQFVVLDASLSAVGASPPVNTRQRYLAAHIPNASFFDLESNSDHSTQLPHMLPTTEDFSRAMSKLGIGDDTYIVVYEQEGVFSAPRAWWMLRSFGAKKVYVLDGGLQAWLKTGYQTQSGPVHPTPANFTAKLNRDAVKGFAQVQQMLLEHAQVVDARSLARFNGTAPEPRPGIKSGHMPGAICIPFTELIEDGRMKSRERLFKLFTDSGLNLERPITTTCGSGFTAAVVALGLEIAGAQNVSLYDGSWAEYAQHPEAVIENSK